jgi:Cft2 family RNA processing exonuclease
MRINVIATGSSGNLYELLDKDGNSILIEAGMPRQTYVKHRIGKLPPEMCIISHSHMDHAQYKGEFEAVMPTYLAQEKNVSEHFKAFGFLEKHGDVQTMCFIIKSLVEDKFLFFGTDFEYSENSPLLTWIRMMKVENFLIECNYNDCLIHLKDVTDDMRKQCKRHLSDNDVINFIKKTGAKNPKIITIHGSNRLSADTHTKKYLSSKLITSTVFVAVGVKDGIKNIFII